MTEAHPFNLDGLPKEVSTGVVQIGPVEVEVVQLDDGRRLISVEGMTALLTWMGHDAGPIAEATKGGKDDGR